MRIAMFYHSLVSDWNHGNAHFLRGVAKDMMKRGHEVQVYEPRDAWSVQHLLADHGDAALTAFEAAYPGLHSVRYDLGDLDLPSLLDATDVVLVHEWNDHDLVRRLGLLRGSGAPFRLLFHDTHHRSVSEPEAMATYDLTHYDGVLAFGNVIRDLYLKQGWSRRAWTWHEAADVDAFYPRTNERREGDLVWIGNWGDDERTRELHEFILDPVRALGLKARFHGVRYPDHAQAALLQAGIAYAGWLPNFEAPRVYARFGVTVHVPRRPYVEALPGVPTIRVFEALACGIPLICAPWHDSEGLFSPGRDYLLARDGAEMEKQLRAVLHEPVMARQMVDHGLKTIRKRHTCAHRVDELMTICGELGVAA